MEQYDFFFRILAHGVVALIGWHSAVWKDSERDRMPVNYIMCEGRNWWPIEMLYLINWIIIVLMSAFQFNRQYIYTRSWLTHTLIRLVLFIQYVYAAHSCFIARIIYEGKPKRNAWKQWKPRAKSIMQVKHVLFWRFANPIKFFICDWHRIV